ncbi:MAG: hypothetical protein H7239_10280 [Flavobacterium sp.]|nr:hypothetical protein [Flavobacterium sp.]
MKFTKQDAYDYIDYLYSLVAKENQKEESVFTNFNISNLYNDINNLKLTIK